MAGAKGQWQQAYPKGWQRIGKGSAGKGRTHAAPAPEPAMPATPQRMAITQRVRANRRILVTGPREKFAQPAPPDDCRIHPAQPSKLLPAYRSAQSMGLTKSRGNCINPKSTAGLPQPLNVSMTQIPERAAKQHGAANLYRYNFPRRVPAGRWNDATASFHYCLAQPVRTKVIPG